MKNKTAILAILLAVILIFVIFIASQKRNKAQPQETNQIILFYDDGCLHCADVEKYIIDSGLKNKISLIQKEVYNNQNNAKESAAEAKICRLSSDSIGIPFLWNGKKCLIGNQYIIKI